MSDAPADFREKLSRRLGKLGSDAPAEREAAIDAVRKALAGAGLSFAWLTDLVMRGVLPEDAIVRRRAQLVSSLLIRPLNEALSMAWAATAAEGKVLSELQARITSGAIVGDIDSQEGLARIESAVDTMASIRRRCGGKAA